MTSWILDSSLANCVAEEVHVSEATAEKVINLFEQGNEVAYVARYRVDAHKGLSCDTIRRLYEVFLEKRELNEKVIKAIKSVESKAKSPDEAASAVEQLKQCRETADVTEITKLFASARKTKADMAKSLGLSDVSDAILQGKFVDLQQFVDKNKLELKSVEKIKEHLKYIIADKINKLPETIEYAKKISQLKTTVKIIISSTFSKKAKEDDIKHFQNYKDFLQDARNIQNHQVLALIRGEEKEVLSWNATPDSAGVQYFHPGKAIRVDKRHLQLFLDSLSYSQANLFVPKIKRAIKTFLSKRAELSAIECFSKNLSQLFSQAGLKNYHVLALDPGYKACKLALLDPNGSVLKTHQLTFTGGKFNKDGDNFLYDLIENTKERVVIAIGNGSASTETQKAIQALISKKIFKKDVSFCVVPENGASKYSITPLAEEELPGIPVTEKSAVSIGRRLIDPVAEYVKIEPKHLGLGMYQHSVNEKKLSEALDLVVRDCVSLRGVDVNSASLQLLQKVCGLNKKTASGIIALRQKLGRISSRSQLTGVKGLGPKIFQQCAGFLVVSHLTEMDEPAKKKKKVEYNPLDSTTVHPEKYELAEKLLKRAKITVEDLNTERGRRTLREIKSSDVDEELVISLLTTEISLIPPPPLIKEVRKIGTLKVGEKFIGRVMNQTDFGIFIDIGADCNALAHVKTLRKPFPDLGSQIEVKIVSFDVERRRIAVAPCY